MSMQVVTTGGAVSIAEMPRYKCHKEVHALKIGDIRQQMTTVQSPGSNESVKAGGIITPFDEGFAPFAVPQAYLDKHNPQVGGYYVVYADGHKSYSPAAAFESGYTKIS